MTFELHERALECVKNYKRSEKELVEVLAELDRTKAYLKLGVSSLFRYCVEKLGLSESETQRFTQVTRKSVEVPALKQAIDQGLLTVSRASRIAPVITSATQDYWIDKAIKLSHREIEREVAKENPKVLRKEKIEARTAERSELRLNISRQLEAKIRRAQEVFGVRNIEETFEKVLDLALKQKDPIERAKRSSEKIALRRSVPNGPSSATRQIVQGRQVRPPIPARLKYEIYVRDNGSCSFKNCGEKRWLHLHHIQPLSMGEKDCPENLMLLCSAHHRMMHDKNLR